MVSPNNLDNLAVIAAMGGQSVGDAINDVFDSLEAAVESEEIRMLAEASSFLRDAINRANNECWGDPEFEPWPKVKNVRPIAAMCNFGLATSESRLTVLAQFEDGDHYVFMRTWEAFSTQWEPGEWEEDLVKDAVDETLVMADGALIGDNMWRWNGLTWKTEKYGKYALLENDKKAGEE